jgi:hypothetical protein
MPRGGEVSEYLFKTGLCLPSGTQMTDEDLECVIQEVVEYWAEQWSKNDQNHQPPHEAGTGLEIDTAWYRDILRAKLVSMHIPKRLLLAYRDQVLAVIRRLESSME